MSISPDPKYIYVIVHDQYETDRERRTHLIQAYWDMPEAEDDLLGTAREAAHGGLKLFEEARTRPENMLEITLRTVDGDRIIHRYTIRRVRLRTESLERLDHGV